MFTNPLPRSRGAGNTNNPIFTGVAKFADGSAAAPSISFANAATAGIFRDAGSGRVGLTQNGICVAAYTAAATDGMCLKSSLALSWSSNDPSANAADLLLQRDAANTLALKNGNTDQLFRTYGGNAGYWERGSISENLVLSTVGTTTDTAANLLPANAIIEAVTARITTTIATATDWKLGDATIVGRFTAANATLAAGTTSVGLVHIDLTGTSGPRQTAAAKLRVTTTGTPSAGAIRITTYYRTFVPATS